MERMIKTIVVLVIAVFGILLTGCTVGEKVAESLSAKNVAGSGLISVHNIGIDPETKIPSMKSTVISGDFQTIKSDSNYFNYREEESSAWYNAENKTRRQSLTITANGDADMAAILCYALNFIGKLPDPKESHPPESVVDTTAIE